MDYTQQINAYFDRFNDRFNNRVPQAVSDVAIDFFRERFVKQDWDGVPWQPLKPKTAAQKTKGAGRILTRTGQLAASVREAGVTPDLVVITAGTRSTPYARAHNEGLRIVGIANIKGFTNLNFMGRGKPVQIKAHSRKINFKMPQRQFMGPSRYLNQRIVERLKIELDRS